MPLYNPSLIDPGNFGTDLVLNSPPVTQGPFEYAGNVYSLLNVAASNGASLTAVQIYNLNSDGVTWTVLDAAHEPIGCGTWVFDGLHTVYVAYVASGESVSNQTVNLAAFSLTTGTWSAIAATNKPTATFAFQLYVSGAALILLCDNNNLSGALVAYAWQAGAWGNSVTLNPAWRGATVVGCMSSGTLLSWSTVAGFNGRLLFASLAPDFVTVATNAYADPGDVAAWKVACNPVMVGGSAWLPLDVGVNDDIHADYKTFAQVNPVNGAFALMPTPGIDPVLFANQATNPDFEGTSSSCPFFQVAGGVVTAIALLVEGTEGGRAIGLQINQTTDVSGYGTWVSLIGFTLADAPPSFNLPDPANQEMESPTIFFDGLNLLASVEGIPGILTDSFRARFWLGNFAFSSSFPVPAQPAPIGGFPASVMFALARARMSAALSQVSAIDSVISPADLQGGLAIGGCKHLNGFDDCVLAEILRTRNIKYPPLCTMPPGVDPFSMPWDEDFGFLPKEGVPFNKSGGILTPASGAGDQVVLSFRVPTGMDGLLSGLWMAYSGAGFLQGSGDIIFRVQRNQVFLKDLSNCPFLLGNPKQPVSMTQGSLLLSGQLVKLIVNVPNLSGLIQVGQSTVSGGLIGFWWARG